MNDLELNRIVDFGAITIDPISIPTINGINASVLRLDKMDGLVSGNKWFKLKYYLKQAAAEKADTLVTFGGAWSNHIVAVATAAQKLGLKSAGIIRGEKPSLLSDTLKDAYAAGMQLHFISRAAYREKDTLPVSQWVEEPCLIIPEGGAGWNGIRGAASILSLYDMSEFTHIICAAGTGTMLSGLILGAAPHQEVLGIAVIKGEDLITQQIKEQASMASKKFHINFDYHFGGYAKKTPELIQFMNEWYAATGIPSDFVYTAKLFYAVNHLINTRYFPANSKLLVIHSGGLQGNRSLLSHQLCF